MQRETSLGALRHGSWQERIDPAWRMPLARLALVWSAILIATSSDWIAMAAQWWNISTYNHILLIPIIVGALIWARREELAKIAPRAWWPGLIGLGGAMFVWLLGSLGQVNTISQFGAVAALQMSIVALLGPRVGLGLLFPLAYMLFLVPFGDELVPALQMITAEITIALTHLSGIPAEIEGVFIDTPVGLFEVAEACSGVKFLIAMVALGVLVAQTCFHRWRRRAAFMAVCVIVPIIANGLRAWGTIYIAQSQGVEFAMGFDHVFYGWVFFALVIAAVLGLAWRWFDRSPEDPGIDGAALASDPRIGRIEGIAVTQNTVMAGSAIVILGFALWASLASGLRADLPETISLPQVDGWEAIEYSPELAWEPLATGAEHKFLGRYRSAAGLEVDVFVAAYASQEDGREATAPASGALIPETLWRWMGGGNIRADAKVDQLYALGRIKRRAETSYRAGDMLTGSAATLKLAAIRDRIALRAHPTTMLILSSVEKAGQDPEQAIAAFRRSTGPLGPWIDRIVENR
ncbi:exosortase A [Altererythrobacter sp.]|nr:exosortase A [Altererythrobacter sp.]